MIESSKLLPILLLLTFIAGAIGWTVLNSWGSFDLAEALSGRSFRANDQAVEEAVPSQESGTPTPTPAPVQFIDQYPVVHVSPNPRPLFAP